MSSPLNAEKTALVLDFAWPDLKREEAILSAAGIRCVNGRELDAGAFQAAVESADAIMTCWEPVPGDLLRQAKNCSTVARFGVGIDNIDVATATELGMSVTNVPDYCIDEVSDHALALALALTRNVVALSRDVRHGGWDNLAGGPMPRLRELTFGVVGVGRIGARVLEKARHFGFQLKAFSPSIDQTDVPDDVTKVGTFEDLLRTCDIVSLHAPLNPETKHLLNTESIAMMRPGAYLVNTSRGGLVDTKALISAVEEGHLAGAGLDVLEQEPPELQDQIRRTPGVIVTPHASFSSVSAQHELRDRTAENVVTALSGELPGTTINAANLVKEGAGQK